MKRGTCPKCEGQHLEYESVYKGGSGYLDTLFCPICQFFITAKSADYNRVHNQAFPAVTADDQEDRKAAQIERVVGYWDNRCAAISPVGKVSGCGTRVEGHCDVRD